MNNSRNTTMAFAGPHRALVTAWAAPCIVFTAGHAIEMGSDPWDSFIAEPVALPAETLLTDADFDRFREALDEESPNAALVRAMARRIPT
ncbi:MAG: hypothetical protein H6736_22030 [Alphaproteobacteria bacterium]|nr:hypothetical protein [Alphaproteobacteria bacterium]